MALQAVAGTGPVNVDLTGLGKGKRVASWHFSTTVAAATINLRNGSIGGAVLFPIRLAVGTSASRAFTHPEPVFPLGVFVEIAAGGAVVVGSVDLV